MVPLLAELEVSGSESEECFTSVGQGGQVDVVISLIRMSRDQQSRFRS